MCDLLNITFDCPNCKKEMELFINANDKDQYDVCCDICGEQFTVDTHDFYFDEFETNLN